jgi:oligopeptide/dipeptide ABC transporter ATP-binding protein
VERSAEPLLSVRGLSKRFPVAHDYAGRPTSWLWAVDFVDLDVHAGETLALIGESGCGKTTLARLILRLLPASSGSVRFERLDVLAASERELRSYRKSAQLLFQDPYGSLDPRMTVESIVGEGLPESMSRLERRKRVCELLGLVELPEGAVDRRPHEFSGGERQRISIARALAVSPSLLVADEPVRALDNSVQGSILNLLADLRERLALTCLLITHDLSVVRHTADRVAVMYLGKIVEAAPTGELFASPLHPYTRALIASAPSLRPGRRDRVALVGEPLSPIDPPACCRFVSRCSQRLARCAAEVPLLEAAEDSAGLVACFNPGIPSGVLGPQPAPLELAEPDRKHSRGEGAALGRFIGARLLLGLLVLLVGSAVIFFGMNAAPGTIRLPAGEIERMALDEPAGSQYAAFLGNLVAGDPGSSFVSGAEVGDIVREAGGNTLKLAAAALVLVYTLAIPLGILSAWRRNSVADQGTRLITVLAMGIPNFFLAILLIRLFGLELGWLPVAGTGDFEHLILPAVVLAVESLAINVRLLRSSLLDELSKDYIRVLRGKGLSTWRVLLHALRNALVPQVAFVGVAVPLLLGYTLVVEVIFRFEGLGYHLVQSVLNRDYVLGTTLALLFMTLVVLFNLIADLAHRMLDPRIREAARPA